nr:MBL fold metallo-hydrolase [uncultured Fluviicola sp.]
MQNNKQLKFVLLNFVLILFLNFAYGQTNSITIRFVGNCGLRLTDGTSTIYVDFPYKSGAYHYMEYDKSEIDSIQDGAIFIFTHRHADHYSKRILKKLNGRKFGPWNIGELEKLNASILDFDIRAFKTKHQVYGISFKHDSYLVTWHGKKIYLSGDTENSDTIAKQQGIDWAFVPVWLLMDAKEKGVNLGAISNMFAVYHIGPHDRITNDAKDPKIQLLNRQGERITIPY